MNPAISDLAMLARNSVVKRDWFTVGRCAEAILQRDENSAEGYFLQGLVHRAKRDTEQAVSAFKKVLELDSNRYDAAVELANQYSQLRRNSDAQALLGQYTDSLSNSPRYLDLAGTIYTEIGMSDKAWPLFKLANQLQPNIDLFESNLATCAVFLGKIDEAEKLYKGLLKRNPTHRKNHYQLSRLRKAQDDSHIVQMQHIAQQSNASDHQNIPLFYAIAKELEDLGRWDECFDYYKKGGDTVKRVSGYSVEGDLRIVDKIIKTCTQEWMQMVNTSNNSTAGASSKPTPIFIVGLPRTGTTLVERIVSSHSNIASLGETLFLQIAMRKVSDVQTRDNINVDIIESIKHRDLSQVALEYEQAISYRLGNEAYFIEKLPFNFLYSGIIAKAWPDARIVHMVRNPMDACFSMYKQVFTWAYQYSYTLEDLGHYYLQYDRLRKHWQQLLGDRFIEIGYEDLVNDQEGQTRKLFEKLEIPFEAQCLEFEKNSSPSATASSVQVRSKVHTGSVMKWRNFEKQLAPLTQFFEKHGISVE